MFEPSLQPRVFAVPPGADFPRVLVDGLRKRFGTHPPEALARVQLVVNTRRMARRVRELFDQGPPCLLPMLSLVTDLGEGADEDHDEVEAAADVRGRHQGGPHGERPVAARVLDRVADLVGPSDGRFLRSDLIAVSGKAAQEFSQRRVTIAPQGTRLFGINTLGGKESLIVSLDTGGVERLIRDAVTERREDFDRLGMTAMVFRSQHVPVGPGGMEATESRELTGPVHVPYRLAIFQTGQPVGVEDKYASFLFWAVILLAGAGLCVGGYVLVRLLTREVRLAQLKADFVSNLSHELKTPITSISLFTEMLEDGKLTEPEDQKEAFAVIGQEIRRLQRIVVRMIDVARGEARTTPYNLAPGDLNEPVAASVARFDRIITEPGLHLTSELHPEPLPIQMDVQALDDVVTNLLSNAWKYKRGDEAHIVVRTAKRGRHAELVVQDDGIGIPRAERRKVFEMFYRSEQYLTTPVAGTGLGLALVRSVVAGHKGRIDVDAAPGGVGSIFTLRLPLDASAAASMSARRSSDACGVNTSLPSSSRRKRSSASKQHWP